MVTTLSDSSAFEAMTAPHRRELLAHCYRMTGSVSDAEDLVQDAYLRAWKAFDRFEHRSSVRTWLYQITTNVCLTALAGRSRRPVPSGLEPIPDALVLDLGADPATLTLERQRVRLALVAGVQVLPPRQRAALLLSDVLGLSAAEAADVLGLSVPALKSLLQRARRALDTADLSDDMVEPTDPGARAVLDRYIDAFERSDIGELERLLADDARIEVTSTNTTLIGKLDCVTFVARHAIRRRGDWRLVPVSANGQLAAAAYLSDGLSTHHRYGIAVLATTSEQLVRITLFDRPAVLRPFDLADRL